MSLIPQLEADLIVAATQHARAPRRTRGGRRVALAAAALLLLTVAGAAAGGVIRIGSVVPGDGFFGIGSNNVDERVVATGATQRLGRWKMTTFRAPTGAACLKLTWLRPPDPRLGPERAGYCSGRLPGFRDPLGYGLRRQAARRGSAVVWGTAPLAARSIRLTSADGTAITAPARRGPAGDRHRYWLIEAPMGLDSPSVTWRDAGGRVGRAPVDLTSRFTRPYPKTVVLRGRAPAAGRWQLVASESRRHVHRGDVYEPEGLSCLTIYLDRGVRFGPASGGCGDIANAPGFTRGQHTVRDARGRNKGEILIYGRAPDHADRVEIARAGLPGIATKTHTPPKGVPGRFWLTAISPRYSGGHIAWFSKDGTRRGPPVEVMPP
jgi:hypothetical protein